MDNEKLTVIITMAGLGTRFKNVGYTCPKYMIEVKGKSLFEWSMDSLAGFNDHTKKYIFVVRKEDNSSGFIKEKIAKYGINNVDIIEISEVTDGQASTCMLALEHCEKESPILIYNIDTYVEPLEMRYEYLDGEGHIPCFKGKGDHWSFVRTDSEGNVVEIREKKRISENCTLGAYYFSSAKLYETIYRDYYSDNNNLEKGEKYIAPLYNYMIKQGIKVTISMVHDEKVHVLGTPEEVEEFARE